MAEPQGSPKRESPKRVEPGWRPTVREVLGILVVVLILVFALVNLEDAKIDFVFGEVTIPIFFVIAVPGLVGFIGGAVFQHYRERRHRG
ncbi:MAG TPA: hypothetical protein VLV81_05370 [Acidimicrobiia bacterium]|nr:hypothetical protein [Acidimicrobiia bacterium]